MRMRTLTRSLAVGLAAFGLAAAGTTAASACGGDEYNWVNKDVHKNWTSVNVSDDDHIINDSVIFKFGPMQND
ncbi:hypothetical protein ABZ820_26440 [Streptomyces diacarni]|uniref:Lipoprotein n=2 Tax=Streptomyces TaxID=1883 RepID=A0A367EKM2_9ACTN|nr:MULTISPECIES: hypothetical protein [Streptomyces]RCG18591.1 hypothetical protein DTL70_25875 [Streptomyces diacarni]UNT00080.1 hypothetical protein MMF93_29200 [Streptomyces tubbatahanensis]